MPERLFTEEDIAKNNRLIAYELGEVAAMFTIKVVPKGGAPDSVKEAWVGVSLPVRDVNLPNGLVARRKVGFDEITQSYNEINEPIPVYGLDAVMALDRAGKQPAARYWLDNGFVFASLVFRGQEGTLVTIPELGRE